MTTQLTFRLSLALLAVFAITSALPAQETAKRKSKVSVRRDVEYGRAGARSLKLDVYEPSRRSGEPLPVIVWIHGGGWRGGSKASGTRLVSFVASGEYVGVSVGYRLSGESLWPAQIHDCKAAIRWIRSNAKQLKINPDRIGVWGSSAGGHLVSLLGTSSDIKSLDGDNGSPDVSSRVACVVDFCGPADLSVFKHPRLDQLFGKPYDERRAEAKTASPAAYVSKDDPPILIVHGTDDRTVPFSQAENFHSKLKKAGVPSTFVKMDGGGHSIAGKEVILRVKTFFAKHLLRKDVDVSDAPIKPETNRK